MKFLKLSGTFEPDDVIVLLTAPTGVAAFTLVFSHLAMTNSTHYEQSFQSWH